MRSLTLLAVFAAFALGSAAPASAAPFSPELEADYAAALAWWGVSSPPLCATVIRELEPTDFQHEGAIARSTQPADPWGGACYMTVFQDGLDNLRREFGSGADCAIAITIRHEVGHLLGYSHSDDPTSIMHSPAPRSECIPPTSPPEPPSAPSEPLPTVQQPESVLPEAWREWRREKQQCLRQIRHASQHRPQPLCRVRLRARAEELRWLASA